MSLVIKQMMDTPIDLSVAGAFAEGHLVFIDENGQWVKVILDIESTVRVLYVMDDKTAYDSLQKEMPLTYRVFRATRYLMSKMWGHERVR